MTTPITATVATADPGPIPHSLKRTEPVDYGELSAAELAKLINDEYSMVLAAERSNLPRAKAIGEKLEFLRAGTPHGEWQKKLKKWCPRISYETANRYIKLYEKWPTIEQKAAAKSVRTTDLTIDDALKLLAKPPKADTSDSGKASEAAKPGGVEPADSHSDEDVGKEWLRALDVDELVIWLSGLHDTEYLTMLCAALAELLKPPESKQQQPSQVPAGSGFERRV